MNFLKYPSRLLFYGGYVRFADYMVRFFFYQDFAIWDLF